MKYPKWYNTYNVFGYYLFAGIFNPDKWDKRLWNKIQTLKVLIIWGLLILFIIILITGV